MSLGFAKLNRLRRRYLSRHVFCALAVASLRLARLTSRQPLVKPSAGRWHGPEGTPNGVRSVRRLATVCKPASTSCCRESPQAITTVVPPYFKMKGALRRPSPTATAGSGDSRQALPSAGTTGPNLTGTHVQYRIKERRNALPVRRDYMWIGGTGISASAARTELPVPPTPHPCPSPAAGRGD